MKENEWNIKHLTFGFLAGTIASYMLLCSPYISTMSACMLTIFNFLFVSLTFPLNGTLVRKLSMLLIGDIIGLFWNHLFSLFVYAVVYQFGEIFNPLYVILSPLMNLVWIVSFWSLSLTVLTSSRKEKQRLKIDIWNLGNIITILDSFNDSLSCSTLCLHHDSSQKCPKT